MPHIPDFPGIERFPGRVLHAHDFRDKNELSRKTSLLIAHFKDASEADIDVVLM